MWTTSEVIYTDGAFEVDKTYIKTGNFLDVWASGNNLGAYASKLNASRSNVLYGRSNTVQPSALTCQYYIKF